MFWTLFRRSLSRPQQPGEWHLVDEPEAVRAREALVPELPGALPPEAGVRVAETPLPFWPGARLVELAPADLEAFPPQYLLHFDTGHAYFLDWSPAVIRAIADSHPLQLDRDSAADYVRFSCAHVAGPSGRMVIVEDPGALPGEGPATAPAAPVVRPLRARPAGGQDAIELDATVLFDGALREAVMRVHPDGRLQVIDGPLLARLDDRSAGIGRFPRYGGPPFAIHEGWEPVSSAPDGLAHAGELLAAVEEDGLPMEGRALSFFPGALLVRVRDPEGAGPWLHALWTRTGFFWLHGDSGDIHAAVEREDFCLGDHNVLSYLGFFCRFIRSDRGPFHALATVEHAAALLGGAGGETDATALALIRRHLVPPEVRRAGSRWRVECTVLYDTTLYKAAFLVDPGGQVEMEDDTVLAEDLPAVHCGDEGRAAASLSDEAVTGADLLRAVGLSARGGMLPAGLDEEQLERSVLKQFVRLQLVRSLGRGDAAPLFDGVAGAEPDDDILAGFARFLAAHSPLVVLVSEEPFVEEVFWDLVREVEGAGRTVRTADELGPDGSAGFDTIENGDVLLLSLHRHARVHRPEAIVHRLGVTEALAVVGCSRLEAVPAALARVADMTLMLEGMTPDVFRQLFCLLFACDWPAAGGNDEAWMRQVRPGDLVAPLRDRLALYDGSGTTGGWSPADVLAGLRSQVESRLARMIPARGPALSELHGLGEARLVAEDLIADIRAALAGEVRWEEVDRGALFAGPPGTGKTTLARAMAREAGIHFLEVSGGEWIAGTEHLGEHLQRIRSTFAEARRHAPCILFIDELDSIGSRESFQGRNRQYAVEVVNALLQEVQGFDDRRPVFVIGATNYAERVDPALRRAGRLDQVVHLPRPDRTALARIFEFYLRPYAEAGTLASDVDLETLGSLALGATGADVEMFVRDAARRARRAGEPLGQRHLAAAATRAPRGTMEGPAAEAGQLRRTAVHEAGHALALMLCRHYPARIDMISIVPRADGSLGFTASGPAEHATCALTRQACLEYLQVLLAGRAAEELHFGPDGISSGAGGASEGSDLARATRWATYLVCQAGMGPDGALPWRETPRPGTELDAVTALLDQAYEIIGARLAEHRQVLDELAGELLREQELSGPRLQAIVAGRLDAGPERTGKDALQS